MYNIVLVEIARKCLNNDLCCLTKLILKMSNKTSLFKPT